MNTITGMGLRLFGGVAAFLIGVVASIATVAVGQSWPGWLLGVVATFALLYSLSPGFRLRGLAAIGWITGVVLVVFGRPEGDYAIASDVRGIGLVVVAVLGILYAAATLPRERPDSDRNGA
jgi:hypothetical protein